MFDKQKPKHNNRNHDHGNNNAGSSYWMFGQHAVLSALNNQRRQKRKLLTTSKVFEQLNLGKYSKVVEIKIVDSKEISSLFLEHTVHQNIAMLANYLDDISIEQVVKQNKELARDVMVILDQVVDPHNVGAIIRNASAFGIKNIIIPKDNSIKESAIVAKSAAGCLELVSLISVNNIAATIKYLKENNYWIAGMDGDGKNDLSILNKYDKLVVIIGSEGKGMRDLTKKSCDLLVKIPINSEVESLNASCASAIVFYEVGNY